MTWPSGLCHGRRHDDGHHARACPQPPWKRHTFAASCPHDADRECRPSPGPVRDLNVRHGRKHLVSHGSAQVSRQAVKWFRLILMSKLTTFGRFFLRTFFVPTEINLSRWMEISASGCSLPPPRLTLDRSGDLPCKSHRVMLGGGARGDDRAARERKSGQNTSNPPTKVNLRSAGSKMTCFWRTLHINHVESYRVM